MREQTVAVYYFLDDLLIMIPLGVGPAGQPVPALVGCAGAGHGLGDGPLF